MQNRPIPPILFLIEATKPTVYKPCSHNNVIELKLFYVETDQTTMLNQCSLTSYFQC